jgi:hypothetical protein
MAPRPTGARIRRGIWIAVVLIGLGWLQTPVAGQESHSAPLARELAALLMQRTLGSYAMENPDSPDEFIAALFFPNAQLLVVSARPTAPAVVDAQLANKQYDDVYAMLHQASIRETKVFFQDMNADGLQARPAGQVDVQYEQVVNRTIFDAALSTHQLTDSEYAEKFAAADARYSRLLAALVADLKKTSTLQ